MERGGVLDEVSRLFFSIGMLFENLFEVVIVDVVFCKRDECFEVRQLLIVATFVDKDRRDTVAFGVSRYTTSDDLVEIGVGSDVLTIEERTINGKVFDGLLVLRNEFFIVERDVLVE